MPAKNSKLEWRPLTQERWRDFEALFGERGACGGCWCMWPRLARSQYKKQADAFVWTGLSSAFVKAGFKEVERRSETRPIMRYEIKSVRS